MFKKIRNLFKKTKTDVIPALTKVEQSAVLKQFNITEEDKLTAEEQVELAMINLEMMKQSRGELLTFGIDEKEINNFILKQKKRLMVYGPRIRKQHREE